MFGLAGTSPSSLNRGSCGFTTGCWSEAVAYGAGNAAGVDVARVEFWLVADALGFPLSASLRMSDVSKSSADFWSVVLF